MVRLIVCSSKNKAHAHLARRVGDDSSVLASCEYHPDINTGWHLHAICGQVDNAPTGTLVHGPWVTRLPSARSFHRRKRYFNPDGYGDAEAWLWRETMRFFGVDEKGPLV